MPSLRDLQRHFAAALFDDAPEAIAPSIRGDGLDSAARVGIYRNNLREGFIKTLALEFPVVQRLVGEEYFRQLALLFLSHHPSHAGNLHFIGEPFALFLHRWFQDTSYAYLPDVAALEWAYQEAMLSADLPPLELDALRRVAAESYSGLCFRIHPGCRLLRSAFPILWIWSANQPGAVSEELIDLRSGPDFVLVRRATEGIEFRRLPAADFTLLEALAAGASLSAALEAAQFGNPDLDLGAALRNFLALGVFTELVVTSNCNGAPP
jgi:hypothetical protein